MLESIAFALAKTLITFLFEQQLENAASIRIEGAPSWYYQQTTDHICTSSFSYGGYTAIEDAKNNAKYALENKIAESLQVISYQKNKEATAPDEKLLIEQFSADANLDQFVQSHIDYKNIKYENTTQAAYARACISKQELSDYQHRRAKDLAKKIATHRSNKSFEELENSLK